MKKVFRFKTVMMNGTVTMMESESLFSSRELAEKTRADMIATISGQCIYPFTCHCTEVEEGVVFEAKDEIPFYQDMKEGQT